MEEKNINGAQIYICNILDNSHETITRHCIAQQILKCDLCVDMFVS